MEFKNGRMFIETIKGHNNYYITGIGKFSNLFIKLFIGQNSKIMAYRNR